MGDTTEIKRLVKNFGEQIESYKKGKYNETQLRREYLDPFFTALGWDIENSDGHAEAYKDVVHEDSIKVGGATKAPDYSFRVGGTRKFFVEAKKPSINIKDDPNPAYQLRRYAWSAKLPLSILTDFEEFAIYDCRVKPEKNDKPSKGRILYIKFDEFLERWDEIASVFSKTAIMKGAFDKYAESKKRRGTAEVDDEFLKEMESWRESLAKNIAFKNSGLTIRELNHAVQLTIDRIVFLRICEDRGIEPYGKLQALLNGKNVYERLVQLFMQADDKYNSGLFHFTKEKDRPGEPDSLTPSLEITDAKLKDIIKRLYYPESPYEFSVISGDILGQVYERFLGKVIVPKGRGVDIEEKPEVRKAGGVYYTPTYIVDYIVKNTVGKLVEDSTPKKVEKLRILDPACGSGSFLIGAYQYLLDWHRDWYANNEPKKHSKGKQPKVFLYREHDWRLTTSEKKRILLNNIYGVDIDTQAVEVTKLSLLLKVLEGESQETLLKQFQLFKERALPDLRANIKCGNSLIGPDFYTGKDMSLFGEEEQYRINVFNWQSEFATIMKAGGFDVVIGNPPYVRQEGLGEFKEYFSDKYKVYHGVADLYTYFIERGVSLLRNDGLFSYIVANKWMRANYGEPLRRWMKGQEIVRIIDFGDLPVFQGVTTYPCIPIIKKGKAKKKFEAVVFKELNKDALQEYINEHSFDVALTSLDDKGWTLIDEASHSLLEKLKSVGVPLGEYVDGNIYRGVLTGLNEAFVIDEKTKDFLIKEDPKSAEIIKPFLAGRDIKRYESPVAQKHLILFPKGFTTKQSGNVKNKWKWLQKTYPSIAKHLEPFTVKGEKRYDKGEYWWELRACDYYEEFEKPKIIFPDISERGNFLYDKENGSYSVNTTYLIIKDDIYLLAILNSKLMTYIFKSIFAIYRGGYLRFFTQDLETVPIRTIDFDNPEDVAKHDRMVELVETMLELNKKLPEAKTDHNKNLIQRQIDYTDSEIDKLVYELYGLTADEIKIVEGE